MDTAELTVKYNAAVRTIAQLKTTLDGYRTRIETLEAFTSQLKQDASQNRISLLYDRPLINRVFQFISGSDISVAGNLVAATAKLGGLIACTEFESDGTMKFNADATVFADVQIPILTAKLRGTADPALEQFKDNGSGSVGCYAYNFDDGDEVFFDVMLPGWYKEESTIYPYLHWSPESDADPADNIGIGLEYTWANNSADFGTTTLLTRDVSTGVNKALEHRQHAFASGGITASGKTIRSILKCRLYRQAAVSDNYADGCWFHTFGMRIEMDTCGSRTSTSK